MSNTTATSLVINTWPLSIAVWSENYVRLQGISFSSIIFIENIYFPDLIPIKFVFTTKPWMCLKCLSWDSSISIKFPSWIFQHICTKQFLKYGTVQQKRNAHFNMHTKSRGERRILFNWWKTVVKGNFKDVLLKPWKFCNPQYTSY